MGVPAVISEVKLLSRLPDCGFPRNDDYLFRGSIARFSR